MSSSSETSELKCLKKARFANEKLANEYIARLIKTSTREIIPARSYFCKCGAWHLTSSASSEASQKLIILKQKYEELKKEKEDLIKQFTSDSSIAVQVEARVTELKRLNKELIKKNEKLKNDLEMMISKKAILELELNKYKNGTEK